MSTLTRRFFFEMTRFHVSYYFFFFFFICNWWPFQNKLRLDFAFFVCTIYIVKQTVVSILLKKNICISRKVFFPSAASAHSSIRLFFSTYFFFVSSAVASKLCARERARKIELKEIGSRILDECEAYETNSIFLVACMSK